MYIWVVSLCGSTLFKSPLRQLGTWLGHSGNSHQSSSFSILQSISGRLQRDCGIRDLSTQRV